MTDKEIIKVLECCSKEICTECVIGNCPNDIANETLDLIKKLKNREKKYQKKIKFQRSALRKQQEEIERFADIGKMYSEIRAEARAEAIKEFAEQLKTSFVFYTKSKNDIGYMDITTKEIDDLVKEMLGEEIKK